MTMGEIEIIEGEFRKPEKVDTSSAITEFFFEPELHRLVKFKDTNLEIDGRGMTTSVLQGVMEYIRTLHNPNYHIHNKSVRVIVGSDGKRFDIRELEGVKILGVPADFSSVIDHILFTGKFEGTSRDINLVKEPQKPMMMLDNKNNYIVFDVDKMIAHEPKMIDDLNKILSKHISKNPAVPHRVWLIREGKYVHTDIFFDGYSTTLLDDMRRLYARYDFVCLT